MTFRSSFADRLRALMERAFAPYRRLSPGQVELSGMRVMQRLRQEPMWESLAPLATAGAATPAKHSLMRFAVALAPAIVLVVAVGTAVVWRPADPALYRVVEGDARIGDTIRSNGGAGAVLSLSDGSRVEMRSNSELSLDRADDGVRIRLNQGGIIVNAAKQRTGHLYVQTNDMTVSVIGTVFVVNADDEGSRVAVIEGEVRVQQGPTGKTLVSGQRVTTNPSSAALSVIEEIAWSRNAEAHRALLQQVAVTPAPALQLPAGQRSVGDRRPTFEVTTIRPASGDRAPGGRGGGPPNPSGCGNGLIQVDPRRVVLNNVTLQWLITRAYNPWSRARGGCAGVSNANLLVGGPGWIRSDKWDVDALIPTGGASLTLELTSATDTDLHEMLRSMLAERFKLVLRPETKEMSVYLLTVANDGPRFNGRYLLPNGKPRVSTYQGADGTLTRSDALPSGTFKGIANRNNGNPYIVWEANISMSEWAAWLNADARRPVLDRTGLVGEFLFHLESDEKGASRPPLLRAIEEIGLKLEEAKALVEVWVIERAEKPTEN